MRGVCCVVGGQFGSEGKGHVVARLAEDYEAHVRVGAANAGHTFYTQADYLGGWEKHVVQQLPCAAYANPEAALYIGPGALISRDIFWGEVEALSDWRQREGLSAPNILVDHRAHIIGHAQIDAEIATGLAERIGSTSATAGEGIGQAQADRVMRSPRCQLVGNDASFLDAADERGERGALIRVGNVPAALCEEESILLEGTQGVGLSLTTGDFPYVTSRNATAAGLCADTGVAPGRLDRVVAVFRTFPIRVAGNSGPFAAGSEETTWDALGVDPESERTTVTRKVRRVATFSWPQLDEAVGLNGATEAALMFADYVEPGVAGVEARVPRLMHSPLVAGGELLNMALRINRTVRLSMIGTGPHSMIYGGE